MEDRILLKLGGRQHLGEFRWSGALNEFTEVYCTCLYREGTVFVDSEQIHFYEIPNNVCNRLITVFLRKIKKYSGLDMISWIAICVLKGLNYKLIQKVKVLNPHKVLCSYSCYDWSDLNCILFAKSIQVPIVRSYKESRVEYNFLEYNALKLSDTVVLCDVKIKEFLEKKYGNNFFDNKKIILGPDENALPACIIDNVNHKEKYSIKDGKIHLVILASVVDSEPCSKTTQSRYYYIEIIKKIIEEGIIVHLHCRKFNEYGGGNRYKELADAYQGKFYIEEALDMAADSSLESWINSCEILSQYDIGFFHNVVEGSSISDYDKINVPHKFFAYGAAHVVPVVKRGDNDVLEKMFDEKNCGFVFDELSDLKQINNHKFDYYIPTYESYLKSVFDL